MVTARVVAMPRIPAVVAGFLVLFKLLRTANMNLLKMVSGSFHAARKTVGFVLFLSAMSTPAWAVDITVPEIDAGSLMSAIAIAGFGAMMMADRLRSR